MSLRNSTPVRFSPQGLSDALDATNVFPGAMTSLQNLIPDPTTKNVWTCRPAAIQQTAFPGFVTPGFVSAEKVIGTRAYGMIASGANAGHDEPFVYDIPSATFIALTGVTGANTPTSPATVGAWVPPTMDLIGSKLVVTHPGFTGAGGVMFGWFDLANPAAPTWNGGNTATNALPLPPTAVKNFFGRAYYIVPVVAQPGLYFSDVLDPLTITTGTNIITFDDNIPLVALGGLPLNNQLGGIIAALIVFKQNNAYQITGDAASTAQPLTKNAMNVAVGTLAPNAVTPTPKGLAFLAVDGVRVIDFKGTISDPIGIAGMGVTVPFINVVTPSRAAAACNAAAFRITVDTSTASGVITNEYWYDINRAVWSGPHTFPAALIQVYASTFIMSAVGINAKLWQSDGVQHSTSTFVENGFQLSFMYQTTVMPDTQTMSELNMLETTINVSGSANNVSYTANFITSDLQVLDTVNLTIAPSGSAIWGSFTWGGASWSLSTSGLTPLPINWHQPIVFRKGSFAFSGFSALGFKIGDLFLRYEQLGYLQQRVA